MDKPNKRPNVSETKAPRKWPREDAAFRDSLALKGRLRKRSMIGMSMKRRLEVRKIGGKGRQRETQWRINVSASPFDERRQARWCWIRVLLKVIVRIRVCL